MVDRVYQRNAIENAPQPPATPSAGYPTDGNPEQGIAATLPGAYWFHMVTESLRRLVVDAGRVPDHQDLGLVSKSVLRYVDDAVPEDEYRMIVKNGIPMLEKI